LYGPTNPACLEVQTTKHRLPGETFEQAKRREATALGTTSAHADSYYEILVHQRFLAAGRIQSGAGRQGVTMFNCFVAPTIEDSFVDGRDSIMGVATQAATTMRMGGGIGYNFGTLRPKNDWIRGVASVSGGPVSFMPIYGGVCHATSSYGNRRGAQMGVLPMWHPDVRDFITAKTPPPSAVPLLKRMQEIKAKIEDPTVYDPEPLLNEFWDLYNAVQATLRLTEFNISVGVTDHFMDCLENGYPFDLEFPKGTKRTQVDPKELWDMLMANTWDWAEPGVLFIDRINNNNNLWYCETIAATNPCGEQPLPPHGACLLGSFNLCAYLVLWNGSWMFNWDQFRQDIPIVVEAMDNVIDASHYPLKEQEIEAKSKRRMGLGVTGVANALETMGAPYGSARFLDLLDKILMVLCYESYRASIQLARRKGSFPMLNAREYLQSGFVLRCLPDDIKEGILKYGIRNSHLLSIAPTGTISFAADNISSSIEPVYSYTQKRLVRFPDGMREVIVNDYAYEKFGTKGKRTKDVTIDEHLAVLALASKWTDSAVSKTCNVPPTMSREEFSQVYIKAYKMGCRGCTTFNSGGLRAGILQDIDDDEIELSENATCTVDPITGRRSCE
jgi:ribonucleoside-diphosphate reductase alpha chain